MSQMLTFPVARTYTCDVLVVGGGVSGISAAICAARMGVSVLLAERDGCLGGTASVGLVGPFMSCFDPTGTEQAAAFSSSRCSITRKILSKISRLFL